MKKIFGITGMMLAATVGANAALIAGDSIMIDFGTDAGNTNATTPQGNSIATPGNDIATGNLVTTTGATVTEVAFSTTVPAANTGENNGSSTSSNYSSIFPTQAQDDAWFESNAGQFTFSFTGLDDSLTYNLTVGAYWIGGTAAQQDNRDTGWEVNGVQKFTTADSLAGSYVTFENIAITGDILTITTWDYDANGDGLNDGNNVSVVSALQLTAVPEPSSSALLLGGMGAMMLLRRRS